jgi:hypothetical protein
MGPELPAGGQITRAGQVPVLSWMSKKNSRSFSMEHFTQTTEYLRDRHRWKNKPEP